MKTRPKSETTRRSAKEAGACYVYGIVRDDARLPGARSSLPLAVLAVVRDFARSDDASEILSGHRRLCLDLLGRVAL